MTTRGIVNFSKETVKRMNPLCFQNSLSTASESEDSALFERHWQVEFYRAASSLVPNQRYISPDVGPRFGGKGYIDFYINHHLAWGVELLREGKGLAEHQRRFASDGRYANLQLSDYILIDFRAHKPRKISPKTLYVIYSEDYRQVIFVYESSSEEATLMGNLLVQ